MTGWFSDKLDFASGLGFRLAFLLSLAILPIGLISLAQTLSLSREAERAVELSLIGRTSAAAAGERALLQGALGTADALGPATLRLMDDPGRCHALMMNFVERSASYVYAGFADLSGVSRCNSSGETVDLRESPVYQKFMRVRGTMMAANTAGPVSRQSVVVVVQPLYRETELLGYVAVSLTQDLLISTHAARVGADAATVVSFDSTGDVLSSFDLRGEQVARLLPRPAVLAKLLEGSEALLRAASVDGRKRIYAAVPIVPGLAQAVGIFTPEDSGVSGLIAARVGAILLPLALWAASLAVAYFAVYRLVLRPIRELRGQMRRFAVGDRTELPRVMAEAPAEIADVSRTFHNMARILIRDEHQLEEAVAEKTVLLKEVHHRVKNNLQLIASIINMQGRMIDDPDAKRVLRSVQDRVASLAAIYRNLYQAEHLDSVDADQLLADIADKMTAAADGGIDRMNVTTDISRLTLLPDQAVPLTLLATEAITNALKYATSPAGSDKAWVRISLRKEDGGVAVLEVANSIGGPPRDSQGTGLGSQLIEAFAMQLDTEAEIIQEPDEHVVRLRFHVERAYEPAPEPEADRPVVLTSAARGGATH